MNVSILVYSSGGLFSAYLDGILLAKGGNFDLVVANAKVEIGLASGKIVDSVSLVA